MTRKYPSLILNERKLSRVMRTDELRTTFLHISLMFYGKDVDVDDDDEDDVDVYVHFDFDAGVLQVTSRSLIKPHETGQPEVVGRKQQRLLRSKSF